MADDLRARARRAYEGGRLRAALPWAAPALLLGLSATALGAPAALLVAAVLALALVALRHHGREPGRGAVTGLFAGAVAFAGMAGWMATTPECGGCAADCLAVCLGSGAAAGLILLRQGRGRDRSFTLAAIGIASATAAVACVVVGGVGLTALAAVAAIGAPAALRVRAA